MKNKLIYVGLGSVLTLVLTMTTISFANNTGDINACVNKTNGNVRIVDGEGVKDCSKNEVPVSWNEEGEQGPEGPMGLQGEPGPAGPQGEPGTSGWDEDRIASLEQRVLALEESNQGEDPGDEPYDTSLTFSLSPSNPDQSLLVVEEDNNTEFTIFVFDVEAGEDGPVTIQEFAIRLDTPGGVLEDIVDEATAIIDGEWYDVSYYDPLSSESRMLIFEPDTLEIEAGESVEIALYVEIEAQDFDNYELGQTIQASVRSTDASYWEAEGYDDLNPATQYFGDAIGEVHELNLESEEPEEE